MITDERTATYIDSLATANTPLLDRIEQEAVSDGVPVIRRATQSYLKFILADKCPHSILEIGTAVGFSAIFFATYAKDAHIDTIENYPPRIEKAKINIASSGMADKINLIEGDAQSVIEDLAKTNTYDMIFMDAAKAQYPSYLPVCRKMLCAGGILVSDNVLFDGDIVQSRFAVRRRDRTIHARMRQFLRDLSEDAGFVTTILPIGDGMTVSLRVEDKL